MAEGGVAEVARVLGVNRYRRRAAQLVADGLVHERDLDAAPFEPRLHLALDLAPEVYLGDADVALHVAVNVLKLGDLLGVEALDQRLGQQHDAVRPAHRAALDDRALDHVTDVRERDAVAAELLGDDGAGGARGLADAEREVAGRTPHRHAQIPAPRRLRILHQPLDQLDADVARGLEAERGDREREPEVVVDRLGNLHDLDGAAGGALDGRRAADEVVAADGDQGL